MNIKVATKYRLYDSKKSILVFYTVIVSILVFVLLFSTLTIDSIDVNGDLGGMEFASAIFLFVLGLNIFKENFRMFIQNSVSRKTIFTSYIISTLIIGAIMALADNILLLISKNINLVNSNFNSRGLLEMIYNQQITGVGMLLITILFSFFINIMFISCGFFITTLYYRMNKSLKIIVSICVPALLFVILPIVDTIVFQGEAFFGISKVLDIIFSDPLMSMLSCLIAFVIFTILSWFLVKKAVVKD